MSKSRKPPPLTKVPRRDPLASLKMADIIISRPVLPAEVMATVVDYLAVSDLLRFARVSRRMHEMVYDDARWVKRLRNMGCWNDSEARRRADPPKTPTTPGRRKSTMDHNLVNGKGRPEVLFDVDASPIHRPRQQNLLSPLRPQPTAADGFDVAETSTPQHTVAPELPIDRDAVLSVFSRVRSVRGHARQEYGKVYRHLAPYYLDLLSTSTPMQSRIFREFEVPDKQAQVLANVRIFSNSDFSPGISKRDQQITEAVTMFDTAALLEFRQGYEYKDIQGRMRQYARVMYTLNGGKSSVDLFLHDNKIINQKAELGSVSDCIDYSLGYGQLSLERVQAYFERLGTALVQENGIVRAVFPNAKHVSLLLLEEVAKEILAPFLSELFEDAKNRGTSMFLRIISGTFQATKQFVENAILSNDADEATIARCNATEAQIFAPHLTAYLEEELAFFRQKADSEVDQWDRALSEQAASAESFLMSNVNRQADKKDFMSSFKQVLMMPVNILPSFSGGQAAKTPVKKLNAEAAPSRPSTPNPPGPRTATPSLPHEAPTDELAAKAALMNSKLENIRSLFSIEIALNLVHAAKSSLDRASQFITLGGEAGESARTQCSAIFIMLVQTVGVRHVQTGFDKAIDHLSHYSPRDTTANDESSTAAQVAPLATFLELVNVGDLIQQMLDVFYESELVRLRISNRDDFLDVNVKEKRKFEAMLDERVAAGLGKGIDVLMDEVEYICATTQLPTDFYPELALQEAHPTPHVNTMGSILNGVTGRPASIAVTTARLPVMDFSGQPTATAQRVIKLVGHHTGMLTGATEKSLLDVFTTEVGLRLFSALTKHIKRQRISCAGSLSLLSDLTAYSHFITQFKNPDLNSYFTALRSLAQIYLIEGSSERDVREMSTIIADGDRYLGVFTIEEVVEFAERRSDWLVLRARVEGKVKGDACVVM